MLHPESPIRRDIRWAAERHEPVTLTADEVDDLERHIEALEEREFQLEIAT